MGTIFALSTGFGKAAIAVIRVSGPNTRFVVEMFTGSCPHPRKATLRHLYDPEGHILDQALVLFFPGPRSETGEDLAEFQVHGGRAVVASVLRVLGSLEGVRPAEPGEFARRALHNGKMDLLDLEGLADLIDADTEWQRRQAVEGGGSLLRGKAEIWREHLLTIRAEIEAGLDFSDEGDVSDRLDSHQKQNIENLIGEMTSAIHSAAYGEKLRDGFKVALLGIPNAGKSSLLNALARRDVAIVSDIPGTTRDRIEVHLDLGGAPVVIFDTAGLQATEDRVEQEGIRRSLSAAEESDLVLWLSPADSPNDPPAAIGARAYCVTSKSDLSGNRNVGGMQFSVVDGRGLDTLVDFIAEQALAAFGNHEPAIITRERHRDAICRARTALQRGALVIESSAAMAAEDLRIASTALEQLLGRIDVEDILSSIFSRFCIGK